MLTDSQSSSIAAGATVNMFLGRPIEFIGSASVARLLMAADAALMSVQWLINIGGEQKVPIASGTSVNVASSPGAGPKDDEDVMAAGIPMPAGSRNQLNVTNGAATATLTRYRAVILP